MDILPFGKDALLINFEQRIAPDISEKVSQLKEYLQQQPSIRALIPAYCSLTVVFNPHQTSFDLLVAFIQEFSFEKSNQKDEKKIFHIPICYATEFALDLENLAQQLSLSTKEIIKLHTENSYHTYMIGFLPGFPYLGKTDDQLNCKRLAQPRKQVAAGSVGLAGNQTGIYPMDAPGGWQIIGKTPLPIFKPSQEKDFLFETGDKVRFAPISFSEFKDIENEIKSGTFKWEALYE